MIDRVRSMAEPHVTNHVDHIRSWSRYFAGQENQRRHCPTSIENLFVMPDGKVKLCERYDQTVGNLYNDDVETVIRSRAARDLREQTFSCQRNCSFTYKRGPRDYWRILRTMSRRHRRVQS